MPLKSVHIVDARGRSLVGRLYRHDSHEQSSSVSPIKNFAHLLQSDSGGMPIFHDRESGNFIVHIKHETLHFVAALEDPEENSLLVIEFLHQFRKLLKEYFGEITEDSVKDNFVLIYELLDEICDDGYPQVTDSKILKEFLTQEGTFFAPQVSRKSDAVEEGNAIAASLGSIVNWRPRGIRYSNNEVFLDVIETVNMSISPEGAVTAYEIIGSIKMRCYLSGMPEVKLGLNDRLQSITTDTTGQEHDVKFHTCVKLSKFENERIISFIPPDGESELMWYRIRPVSFSSIKPFIKLHSRVECISHVRLIFTLRLQVEAAKRKTSTGFIRVEVPVSRDSHAPKFEVSSGSAKYVPEADCFVWKIRHFPFNSAEYSCKATFSLPTVRSKELDPKSPIRIHFEAPYFSISGAQVKYLKVVENSGYHTIPWVRYCTKSGEYNVAAPALRY